MGIVERPALILEVSDVVFEISEIIAEMSEFHLSILNKNLESFNLHMYIDSRKLTYNCSELMLNGKINNKKLTTEDYIYKKSKVDLSAEEINYFIENLLRLNILNWGYEPGSTYKDSNFYAILDIVVPNAGMIEKTFELSYHNKWQEFIDLLEVLIGDSIPIYMTEYLN